MAEDSWMKNERDVFLVKYSKKKTLTQPQIKLAKDILEKYNAHLVRALFGESPYIAQNLKESIIKNQEAVIDGE